jgi:hypothetical protein
VADRGRHADYLRFNVAGADPTVELRVGRQKRFMRKTLQVLLALFGATAIFISLLHIMLGPAAIPGSIPVNATMDSEDRFYATLFLVYGAALLWCVREVEHKAKVVYFLMLTFFVGGLARVASMLAVGLPNTFFLVMTAVELALPVILAYMQFHVSSARPAVRATALGSCPEGGSVR